MFYSHLLFIFKETYFTKVDYIIGCRFMLHNTVHKLNKENIFFPFGAFLMTKFKTFTTKFMTIVEVVSKKK